MLKMVTGLPCLLSHHIAAVEVFTELVAAGRVEEAANVGLLSSQATPWRPSENTGPKGMAASESGPHPPVVRSPRNSLQMTERDLPWHFTTLEGQTGQPPDRNELVGGTLRTIVEHMADECKADARYIDMVLLSYRSVATAAQLMAELAARYSVVPPPDATTDELAYHARWAPTVKIRTLLAVKKWLDLYPQDLAESPAALTCLRNLLMATTYD